MIKWHSIILCIVISSAAIAADEFHVTPAPQRTEGEGPYARLILRGAIVIDGTGAPARGPADIIIQNNRIVDVQFIGNPGAPIDEDARPKANPGDQEMDVSGMYVLPGFVDMHGHSGGRAQGPPSEYVFKLWLAHGITTVRVPGSDEGVSWVIEHKRKSEANIITAPRIRAFAFFGENNDEPIATVEAARKWVRDQARNGADGIKFFGAAPRIMRAALDEAQKRGLRTAMHHAQTAVTRVNVLDSARWGLGSMEHWYGLPEAMFQDRTVQNYPAEYNYNNEEHRFGEAGRLWLQAAEPGSEKWNAVRDELIELDFTIDPTLTIYEASRDLMAARRAEWHDDYTLPSLWEFYAPSRVAHGSFYFDWTTAHEINWKHNYQRWMQFLNDFKNHGGRVTAGSDSGYIYKLYGFGYIEELELLQEAGFHPLEVVRAATLNAAEYLGMENEIGSVEPGKLADLVIVEENPLRNFKVLFGTGHLRVNENNEPVRVGGIRWTIKDGIVFDAKALLADVRQMVKAATAEVARANDQPDAE